MLGPVVFTIGDKQYDTPEKSNIHRSINYQISKHLFQFFYKNKYLSHVQIITLTISFQTIGHWSLAIGY